MFVVVAFVRRSGRLLLRASGSLLLAGIAGIAGMSAISSASAQCTLPYALTNGLVADAAQVMANFNALANCLGAGGTTNSIQYNNDGLLGGVGPLSNGQLIIGATGQAPQAQTLTVGPGIAVISPPSLARQMDTSTSTMPPFRDENSG